MKMLILLVAGVLMGACSLSPQRSGVEIMSNPTAKVYINGKEAGMTPYKNNNLKPGELGVRLVTNDGNEWQKQIRLENYSDTVVDWQMGDQASGYVLSLERLGGKLAGLLVNVSPGSAAVAIDGEIKGFSPIKIENIGEGDKQITVSYPGYKSKTIFAKGISGYQLVVEVSLAEDEVIESVEISTISPDQTGLGKGSIIIKETTTGWLRVRDAALGSGKEIAKVNVGEKYPFLEEENGWTKIRVSDQVSGWVSSTYVEKSE